MTNTRYQLGQLGERMVAEHLESQGWDILERNYRRKGAEIDIVARDGSTTVFVEVRTRRNRSAGGAFESITPDKFSTLRRAAAKWLGEKGTTRQARIDAVTVEIRGSQATLTHHRGLA
ncbi:MAG: YraN family protein [Actinomycetaceae bacterium]|nr:YraN family protein [Actinomycetaceae bacterium]